MLLELMLVGCLVLPTWVGGGACLAIFLTFLARRPVDRRRQGRSLTAELTGAWAMTLIGPIVVLVGGGELVVATSIGSLLAFRQTTAILCVRHRLRAAYEEPTPRGTAVICICLGLVVSVPLIGVCAIGWVGAGAVA
jgi:hypothetical protein